MSGATPSKPWGTVGVSGSILGGMAPRNPFPPQEDTADGRAGIGRRAGRRHHTEVGRAVIKEGRYHVELAEDDRMGESKVGF